jgi:hypothetical protein
MGAGNALRSAAGSPAASLALPESRSASDEERAPRGDPDRRCQVGQDLVAARLEVQRSRPQGADVRLPGPDASGCEGLEEELAEMPGVSDTSALADDYVRVLARREREPQSFATPVSQSQDPLDSRPTVGGHWGVRDPEIEITDPSAPGIPKVLDAEVAVRRLLCRRTRSRRGRQGQQEDQKPDATSHAE